MALTILLVGTALAQDDSGIESSQRIEFKLVYDSMDLALETWDDENPPDTVLLDAYAVASGYIVGIPWHYEKNRDRLSINEQVDEVADDMELVSYYLDNAGYYEFQFEAWIPSASYAEGRSGEGYQGNGTSELEDYPDAREEAREEAFREAIMAFLRTEYTDRNEQIPGTLDGRINWYEVNQDGLDEENGFYVYDITAWIDVSED